MLADRIGSLYHVIEPEEDLRTTSERTNNVRLRLESFGYLNNKALQQMAKDGKVKGMMPPPAGILFECETCIQGKLTSKPFKTKVLNARNPCKSCIQTFVDS